MNRSQRIALLGSVLGIGLLAVSALADVTSLPQPINNVRQGDQIAIPFTLQTTTGETVAAISGQMNYNAALFYSPWIEAGPAAPGFVALGNLVGPGRFRFVIYRDPTAIVQQNAPAILFHLSTPLDVYNANTTITFLNGPVDPNDPDKVGESAASSGQGVSLPNVSFAGVEVNYQNAAQDWFLYQ